MPQTKNIQKGTDIMVFLGEGTPVVYKSIAHATSHTLTLTGETVDVNSKDYGEFGASTVNKINWEMQSENLMTEDYEKLFDLMMQKQKVKLIWGMKSITTGIEEQTAQDAPDYYTPKANAAAGYQGAKQGEAFITSLTQNAPNGENATFSVTFTGVGAITRVANEG